MRIGRSVVLLGMGGWLALSGMAQTRRVLGVMIAEYPAHSGWSSLHADNDWSLLRISFLRQGFSDIRLCKDKEATYQGITTALSGLRESVNPGDTVWIHFSCHGQQMEDLDGDEPDGLDEALIPYDARMYYEKGMYEGESHLRDDELNRYLTEIRKRLGGKGALWVSLDACHSASATRGDEAEGQWIRGTNLIFSANWGFVPPDVPGNGYVDTPLEQRDGWASITVLSACKPYQDNCECKVDGRWYGVLSYSIGKVLDRLPDWAEDTDRFLREVDKRVRRMSPFQTPVFETTK